VIGRTIGEEESGGEKRGGEERERGDDRVGLGEVAIMEGVEPPAICNSIASSAIS
jgi:hypothetical protein